MPTNLTQAPRLLVKGIPGIPQASRLFFFTFSTHLKKFGWIPSDADQCLFFNPSISEKAAVLIWVDDFVFLHESEAVFQTFMANLTEKFIVPVFGPLSSFLGMDVTYNRQAGILHLSQANTTNVLLERAKMTDCNPAQIPCQPGSVFSRANCPATTNSTTAEYRSLIALANFLSCWTRADITFCVNKLCKFMSNPGEAHWKLLKHLLRYLRGTKHLGLTFSNNNDHNGLSGIYGYTDSSFGDCPDTSRSTLAYVFFYHGCIISWHSKLNSYVTTCTNHSEYAALALGAKEAEWLVVLFSQLDSLVKYTPIPLFVDNSGIVSMVFNPVDHASNKHVKIGCHYTRELSESKVIAPQRVATDVNIADLFTKPLGPQLFRAFSSKFMSEPDRRLTHTEHIYMFTAGTPESSVGEVENTPVESVSSLQSTTSSSRPLNNFQSNWPFVSVVKNELSAVSYDIVPTDEFFPQNGVKYEIIFYGGQAANKFVLSKHVGMKITDSGGTPYYVCKRAPKPSTTTFHLQPKSPVQFSSPAQTQPSTSAPSLVQSSGFLVSTPRPTLSCNGCGFQNTEIVTNLVCICCSKSQFTWSCICSQPNTLQEIKQSPAITDPEQIKYTTPILSGAMYHHVNCQLFAATDRVAYASIYFAKDYKMQPAACCDV